MAIIDKIDKLSGTDTRSRNITQAIDKYSGKGPSKNIDDAVKKLDETGTLGKMGIKERIDHLSNAQTMSRDITQAIDRHTSKGPSRNIEEALKWWEEPTPPVPVTEAYAVFDSADGSLVFFRDEPGKYSEGEVIDTKTYYTGVETGSNGWIDNYWNIITARFDDAIKPISTELWFSNFSNLTTITGIDKLDTSNTTNMAYTFRGCDHLASLDVSGFVTSNATDMSYMFWGCKTLTSLDVSGFDTSNVTNMSYMFHACKELTSLDVSGFNTSNVTTMNNMFDTCEDLISVDVSGFDTSNVMNMDSMFSYCSALTSVDVSGFNTSNVTTMKNMFDTCRELISVDVSGFDTSNVTNMARMFFSCIQLRSLDVSGFNTSKVTNMNAMFSTCRSLTADITINDLSKYSAGMFAYAATNSSVNPKITLYGEGPVTSSDIDAIIADVKVYDSSSNIVNGMLSSNVVFDEDVVLAAPDGKAYTTIPITPLTDADINDNARITISNCQMKKDQSGSGEWIDCEETTSTKETTIANWNTTVEIDYYPGYQQASTDITISADPWVCCLGDAAGEYGLYPTKFHLYVEKV